MAAEPTPFRLHIPDSAIEDLRGRLAHTRFPDEPPLERFTVVAPSLPGYTLSFRPGQKRFAVEEMADLFAELMTGVLGYKRFAAQGDDWGAFVSSVLGWRHAQKLIGPWPIPEGRTVDVPTAYAAFPKEILRPPRSLAAPGAGEVRPGKLAVPRAASTATRATAVAGAGTIP